MCTYTFTLDDNLVSRISPQFSSRKSMQQWLQRELELLLIHHAEALAPLDKEKEHVRLSDKIEELRHLSYGWDGMSALPPSSEALGQAMEMIDSMPEELLRYCALFPANDSNVYLQGKFPAGRLTAYLDGKTITYILKSNGTTLESLSTTVDGAAIRHLSEKIKVHCMA